MVTFDCECAPVYLPRSGSRYTLVVPESVQRRPSNEIQVGADSGLPLLSNGGDAEGSVLGLTSFLHETSPRAPFRIPISPGYLSQNLVSISTSRLRRVQMSSETPTHELLSSAMVCWYHKPKHRRQETRWTASSRPEDRHASIDLRIWQGGCHGVPFS